MHYEILTEDRSGKIMLDHILPKLIQGDDTFRVISYKGIGRIPSNLKGKADPQKRMLLNNLPKLVSGYGKTVASYDNDYKFCLFIICDLDNNNEACFTNEIRNMVDQINTRPLIFICFAVEEGEAWLLGDNDAVLTAYPKAKRPILNGYVYDSICGTWELLADAVFRGGSDALKREGWHAVGREKSEWASNIGPHIDPISSKSPSFIKFQSRILDAR